MSPDRKGTALDKRAEARWPLSIEDYADRWRRANVASGRLRRELIDELAVLDKAGVPRSKLARRAGVTRRTLYAWLRETEA